MASEKPKAIIIGKTIPIPPEVWEKICKSKRDILANNKNRSGVSHEEAIYKLILNNCS